MDVDVASRLAATTQRGSLVVSGGKAEVGVLATVLGAIDRGYRW